VAVAVVPLATLETKQQGALCLCVGERERERERERR